MGATKAPQATRPRASCNGRKRRKQGETKCQLYVFSNRAVAQSTVATARKTFENAAHREDTGCQKQERQSETVGVGEGKNSLVMTSGG